MIERFYSMTQYNFKLPQELKDKVEKALVDSGLEGKNEFLEDMVQIYSTHLIDSKEDMNEEIAAYKHINTQSKEVLSKTFSHLPLCINMLISSYLFMHVFFTINKVCTVNLNHIFQKFILSFKPTIN
jgi:metal-responsive CopG/Arc/MetJ family transcriptional regulator